MRITYVAYWGLLEPLGAALVVPSLRALRRRGLAITAISFEKAADLDDRQRAAELRAELDQQQITWHALRYHRRPYVPAKLLDVTLGVFACLRGPRPSVVHGRTYFGGIIGLLAARLLGARFVYHNEGFWPDEQVESGRWERGGRRFRVAKGVERWLYRNADGLLLLSQRSRAIVEAILSQHSRTLPPTDVIPSATELSRLGVSNQSPQARAPRLIYAGNLGQRYPIDPLVRFAGAILARTPHARLEVLALSGGAELRERWNQAGLPAEALQLGRVPSIEVPARLRGCDAGLLFLRGGQADLSGSPTKLGEYWACGLPVVCSSGIGDLDEIVRSERVGVVVDDATGFEQAADALLALLGEPGLRARCRAAAERHYSIEDAVSKQVALYSRVLEPA